VPPRGGDTLLVGRRAIGSASPASLKPPEGVFFQGGAFRGRAQKPVKRVSKSGNPPVSRRLRDFLARIYPVRIFSLRPKWPGPKFYWPPVLPLKASLIREKE